MDLVLNKNQTETLLHEGKVTFTVETLVYVNVFSPEDSKVGRPNDDGDYIITATLPKKTKVVLCDLRKAKTFLIYANYENETSLSRDLEHHFYIEVNERVEQFIDLQDEIKTFNRLVDNSERLTDCGKLNQFDHLILFEKSRNGNLKKLAEWKIDTRDIIWFKK